YPIFNALWLSLHSKNVLSLRPPRFIGLRNYLDLLNSGTFWNSWKATGLFTVSTAVPLVLLSLLLATLIVSRLRLQRFFQMALYAPAVIPGVVAAAVWLLLLDPRGIANQWVNFVIGLSGVDHKWLANPDMVRLSTVLVYLWGKLGFFTIIFIAGLGAIPQSVKEAANVDGATGWQLYRHITLPLLKPTTLLVSIMAMIFCMRTFSTQYLFTRAGAPLEPINVVTLGIYNTGIRDYQIGLASAMSIVLLLVMFVLALAQFRLSGRQEA
ncbi:MAG TPA: sugar ABC transporter permease, partial [Trueperaceae bacterium]|nr:sugar ABC transporter permease [Trueperaceae bacterium]